MYLILSLLLRFVLYVPLTITQYAVIDTIAVVTDVPPFGGGDPLIELMLYVIPAVLLYVVARSLGNRAAVAVVLGVRARLGALTNARAG